MAEPRPGRPSLASLAGLGALVVAVSLASGWWSRNQADRLGGEVAALAGPGDIQLLASDTCAPCVVARGWLQRNAVPFDECSIERDAACGERFRAAGAPGTPLLFVRGRLQLGFSPERVLAGLQRGA